MLQCIPSHVGEEIDQPRMDRRPLFHEPGWLQEASMPPPELRHMHQQLLDEVIGGDVRLPILHAHLGPLDARSTSVHMKHARRHMGLDLFGRNQITPSDTEEGQQDKSGGCGPVLALGTWEAGLITTRPLLQ